jgi:hypothetical protein
LQIQREAKKFQKEAPKKFQKEVKKVQKQAPQAPRFQKEVKKVQRALPSPPKAPFKKAQRQANKATRATKGWLGGAGGAQSLDKWYGELHLPLCCWTFLCTRYGNSASCW